MKEFFQISQHQTSLSRELKAGLTTFLTMSYILFIQPAVLSGKFLSMPTGMDFGALTTATCLSSAIATLLMALYARLPIALAPGMGENFFFVTSLLPAAVALGYGWQVALGVVFISGLLFFILSLLGLSRKIITAFSPSMRTALIIGIGLFITFIGLQNAGLIVKNASTGVRLNPHLLSFDLLVFFFGLFLGAILHVRKIKSYILWSIIGSFLLERIIHWLAPAHFAFPQAILSIPPSIAPIFMKMDIVHALSWKLLPLIFFLLFLNIFDSTGTLIAVTKQAGLMEKEEIPQGKKALIAGSLSAMIGATLGMSTLTNYIESIAGVEQGGRTGLTSLTVALLFLLALFFSPLIATIANSPAITAPALVLVGVAMMKWITQIDWTDYTETLPSFLVIVCIPLTFSIANGIGIGLVCYPLIKLLTGRFKELNAFNVLLGILFLTYFLLLPR